MNTEPLVPTGASPFCADIDSDGDLDCFIGGWEGTVQYFQNQGNATRANFTLATQGGSFPNPLQGVSIAGAAPFCADFDADGKIDCTIGNELGNVVYYANIGTRTAPVFTLRTGSNSPFTVVSVDAYVRPWCGDYDG